MSIFLSLLISLTFAKQDFSNIKIKTTKLTTNLHMLEGKGGNIGVLSGKEGVFIVDDQFAPLNGKIKKAISKISSAPIKYVFNTHWHYDHTGGNEVFGKGGSIIVAHENVRKLLSKDQMLNVFKREVKAMPKDGLPVITFNSKMNFYLNGENISVFHVKNAHTNGDSIIHFQSANVFHMGDTFFKDRFPFIDAEHGGSLNGLIAAVEKVLKKSNKKTRFIPGHGTLANMADLKKYIKTLKDVRKRLTMLKKKGLSLQKIIAKKPLQDLDAAWGQGFIKTNKFIKIVYPAL